LSSCEQQKNPYDLLPIGSFKTNFAHDLIYVPNFSQFFFFWLIAFELNNEAIFAYMETWKDLFKPCNFKILSTPPPHPFEKKKSHNFVHCSSG
jgi:hypothetical protein